MENLFENNGANFSQNKKHRYCLWRIWDESKPKVMFIGLNPSTANETSDDPTIRRIKGLAYKWGYGGFYMLNLFPYVTAYPKELETKLEDEAEWQNAIWIEKTKSECEKIIFAWGAFDQAKIRAHSLVATIPNPYCLAINKNGSPKHPLYIKGDTIPVPYKMKLVNK